jgi:hypothetical protein
MKKQYLERPELFNVPRKYLWATDLSIQDSGEIIGGCARKVYYSLKGYQKSNVPNARSMRIMKTGSLIEKNEQEIDKALGVYMFGNFKFYDMDYNVSGEVDEIADLPDGIWLVEYKTYYGSFSQKELVKGPRPEHLVQGMPYMKFFLLENHLNFDLPIKGIKYIYIDRGDPRNSHNFEHDVWLHEMTDGDSCVVVNGMPRKQFCFNNLKKRADFLLGVLESDSPPPCEFPLSNWRCKSYCNFRGMCKKTRGAAG